MAPSKSLVSKMVVLLSIYFARMNFEWSQTIDDPLIGKNILSSSQSRQEVDTNLKINQE